MLLKRKVRGFIRDFYLFLLFFDKNPINVLNFFRALLKRERVFRFLRKGKVFEMKYNGVVMFINKKIAESNLLKGKVLTDVLDYLTFNTDFKNKTILDVGAWIGDSILLFRKLGAKKIIAYEPIKENVEFAKRIIKKFNIDCKIYPYAVCNEDGIKEFIVEEEKYGNLDLNLFENRIIKPKKIKVKCVSWENVLKNAIKEKVDIAKVDCEGCEKFLVYVNDELIKQIPEWIIECHSYEIAKEIISKFENNNYIIFKPVINIKNGNFFVIILYFRLKT